MVPDVSGAAPFGTFFAVFAVFAVVIGIAMVAVIVFVVVRALRSQPGGSSDIPAAIQMRQRNSALLASNNVNALATQQQQIQQQLMQDQLNQQLIQNTLNQPPTG
jgi:hypothetical protein